jgi:hypothetical protein
MTNDEIRMTKPMPGEPSSFARHAFVSSFVIRISSLFRYSRFRYSFFSALIIILLQGCTVAPTVDLTPINARQRMHINFTRAYFAPSESGEDQIILLSDPIDDSTRTSNSGGLAVATAPPLWQVLSIQLHWRTNTSPKTDSLVASNAVLHWYVYGKPTTTGVGVVHYLGTGSVSISTDATGADVTVSHADLKLADRHGDIRDPFGQFQITTTFHAQTSPVHLQQSLDDVAKAISDADHK